MGLTLSILINTWSCQFFVLYLFLWVCNRALDKLSRRGKITVETNYSISHKVNDGFDKREKVEGRIADYLPLTSLVFDKYNVVYMYYQNNLITKP